MNAVTAFENRKDTLRQQLISAQSADEAIAACVMALEQTACELAQQEQDELCRQRQQAVMALARRAPMLLRASSAKGELVLGGEWAQKPEERKLTLRRALQMIGVFALASLAVHEWLNGQTTFAFVQLFGAAALVGGMLPKKAAPAGSGVQARGVWAVDADAAVRLLAELCQAADVCCGDLALIARETELGRLSGTADEAMLDLLVSLMEATASGREELAMRRLAQAEQYLHMLGVEVVSLSEENAALFDVLPTLGEARTIRPALMKDGVLLRRGMAVCRMERGAAR